MSTTDLFVELIVIGTGAVIWLSLLIFSRFDLPQINPDSLYSLVILLPFASITYVIGIMMDRVADTVWGMAKFTAVAAVFSSLAEVESRFSL